MPDTPATYRFYGELAVWWPLISPPEEYEEESAFAATVLRSASIPVHEVLELGSGGGHNAVHLKGHFTLTLVDLADEMLDVSRALNPECAHQQGDMRTVRLGRSFDAVFVHDAVDYMVSESDLRAAIQTAFVHCRPGGVAVFVPDRTRETFVVETDHDGNDGSRRSGRAVPRMVVGSGSERHVDADGVHVPAARLGRICARRARVAPARPLRPRRVVALPH